MVGADARQAWNTQTYSELVGNVWLQILSRRSSIPISGKTTTALWGRLGTSSPNGSCSTPPLLRHLSGNEEMGLTTQGEFGGDVLGAIVHFRSRHCNRLVARSWWAVSGVSPNRSRVAIGGPPPVRLAISDMLKQLHKSQWLHFFLYFSSTHGAR